MNLYEIYAPELEELRRLAGEARTENELKRLTTAANLAAAIKPDIESALADTSDAQTVLIAFLNTAGLIAGQLAAMCAPSGKVAAELDMGGFTASANVGAVHWLAVHRGEEHRA